MTPSIFTSIATLIVMAIYIYVGFRRRHVKQTFLSYYLHSRQLNSGEVRDTFAGAAISISTVLVFFFTIGLNFGWQVFLSPITLVVGIFLFEKFVYNKITAQQISSFNNNLDASRFTSIGDLVENLYGSKFFGYLVTFVSGLGILAVLVAEIMVGVSVIGVGSLSPTFALFAVAATVFVYAALGGFQTVVETDKWQIRIIFVALACTLLALIFFSSNEPVDIAIKGLFSDWEPNFSMPLALIVNITLVNLCLLPSSLRVWQVAAATKSPSEFGRGLYQSGMVIVLVTIFALLIGKAALFQSPITSVNDLLGLLAGGTLVHAYFIFPLLVVALMSALISTADSAILPLAQTIHGSITRVFNPILNGTILLVLIGISVLTYFLVTSFLDMTVVNWILTIFAITTAIAPVIVVPLVMTPRKLKNAGVWTASIGILLSVTISLIWSIGYAGDISMQPWNCLIGVLLSTLSSTVSLKFFANPVVESRK